MASKELSNIHETQLYAKDLKKYIIFKYQIYINITYIIFCSSHFRGKTRSVSAWHGKVMGTMRGQNAQLITKHSYDFKTKVVQSKSWLSAM